MTVVCLIASAYRGIGPLATILVAVVVLVATCYRRVTRAPAAERRRIITGIALSVIAAFVVVGLVLIALFMWILSRIGPP